MYVIWEICICLDSYNVYHNTLMIFLYEVVGEIEDVDCRVKDAEFIEVCSM